MCELFTRFYNKAYCLKKISNTTDCFCAERLGPHLLRHRESHNPLSPDTYRLFKVTKAAWQFWLQMIWAEPSHETHLTPDKSMDTTAHTNPLTGQSTPINGNWQTWGASSCPVKTWACPSQTPLSSLPWSLHSFYGTRITGPSTILRPERGRGEHSQVTINSVKFQTQDHSQLIAISVKEILQQQHNWVRSDFWRYIQTPSWVLNTACICVLWWVFHFRQLRLPCRLASFANWGTQCFTFLIFLFTVYLGGLNWYIWEDEMPSVRSPDLTG